MSSLRKYAYRISVSDTITSLDELLPFGTTAIKGIRVYATELVMSSTTNRSLGVIHFRFNGGKTLWEEAIERDSFIASDDGTGIPPIESSEPTGMCPIHIPVCDQRVRGYIERFTGIPNFQLTIVLEVQHG